MSDDLIIGLRLPGDEAVPGGFSEKEMKKTTKYLTRCEKLDYLNVIVGTNYTRLSRMEHWPPTPAPHGLFVQLASQMEMESNIPVLTLGE